MQVGDQVTRMLCGIVPMPLLVTAIDDHFIFCGEWKFDKKTGAEIDEILGWNNEGTGSFLQEFST